MDAHFDSARMPVEAVSFIQQSDVKTSVLSVDYWGGYLIYRLYPHNKVVIDDRHDMYGEGFLSLYLSIVHGERGWDRHLEAYYCLLLPSKSALAVAVGATPEWKPVYSDEVAIVFMRTDLGRR